MKEYLDFALMIAEEAGKIMLKYFSADNGSYYKADQTIVTIADNEINHYLIEMVKKYYPDHAVDGEEEKFNKSKYVWVCDPIDGTAQYARGVPVSTFSLALVVDGESLLGVVNDPFTKSIYSASKGQGAYKNGQRIAVNDVGLNDKKSASNYDTWPNCYYNMYPVISELGQRTYLTSLGSVVRSCMCVASGEYNFHIFPGTTNKNCDMAAAKIIVEEAGGCVSDLFGNDQRYDGDIKGAIASNKIVHDDVVKVFKKYNIDKD